MATMHTASLGQVGHILWEGKEGEQGGTVQNALGLHNQIEEDMKTHKEMQRTRPSGMDENKLAAINTGRLLTTAMERHTHPPFPQNLFL